ncbi:MAG: prephenate dehydrogenase/arogenate dehydrogenase family protein [Chloroflexi bacterium]|nr:prephenate dehydrogenase/arogenate dehydrogenase family protein [Chloroflexota bacterium]
MADSKIAIIGTGLIGASVGLNLMARKDRQYEVVGIDRSRQNARAAREMGAVDRTVRYLDEGVEGASMIVLAVPASAAEELLTAMEPHVSQGTIITDTCSTKSSFMKKAEEVFGNSVSVIGGHPMAGSERSGPSAASVDLFQGAAWAVTPSAVARESSVRVVIGLIESAGAVPIYIDPAEHDEIVAAVSHVPLLLSVALFKLVRDSACWEDAEQLAGPGFRDMTRLVMGDPEMATGIVSTNRPAILSWLRRYQGELDTIIEALEISDEETEGLAEGIELPDDGEDSAGATADALIGSLFDRARLERFVFDDRIVGRQVPKDGAETPRAGDVMAQMFMGAYLYGRLKEQLNRGEQREKEAALRRGEPPKR